MTAGIIWLIQMPPSSCNWIASTPAGREKAKHGDEAEQQDEDDERGPVHGSTLLPQHEQSERCGDEHPSQLVPIKERHPQSAGSTRL
jgi:hypothetical protein